MIKQLQNSEKITGGRNAMDAKMRAVALYKNYTDTERLRMSKRARKILGEYLGLLQDNPETTPKAAWHEIKLKYKVSRRTIYNWQKKARRVSCGMARTGVLENAE